MTNLRSLFPPQGRQYELFDCCILLFALTFLGYVVSVPAEAAETALRGPFEIFPEWVWGGSVALCALYGIVASYVPRLVTSGFVVSIAAAGFWTCLFLFSMFIHDVDVVRVFMTALLYGWITRRLWVEEDRIYI